MLNDDRATLETVTWLLSWGGEDGESLCNLNEASRIRVDGSIAGCVGNSVGFLVQSMTAIT